MKSFDIIFVTGPQRSGTRVCAKMIAHDTGYDYVDEYDFGMDSLYHLYSIIEGKTKLVIQCPVLCRYIHLLDVDNSAVVLMRRAVDEIISSQKRIHWRWERLELSRYDLSEGTIAQVKYAFWDNNQKNQIKNCFEINYEDLAVHPLWVEKSLRAHFTATQIVNSSYLFNAGQTIHPIRSSTVFCFEDTERSIAILYRTHKNSISLNATGFFIWGICDGKNNYSDILDALKNEFSEVAVDDIQKDLTLFLDDMVSRGFLDLRIS